MNQPATNEDAILSQIEEAIFNDEPPVEEQPETPEVEAEEVVEEEGTEEEPKEEGESEGEEGSLAAVLGVPEDQVVYDDDGNIVFKAKVDGEEIPVTFQELVKGYQLEKYVTKKSMELSEQQRHLDTEYTTQVTALKEKLDVANSLVEGMKNSLKQEYQQIDWNKLKEVDPGRFVDLREDFSKRARQFSGIEAKLTEEHAQQQEAFQHKQIEAYTKHLDNQRRQLLAHFPEWGDEKVFATETQRLSSFMGDQYGFTKEETNGVTDHRLVRVLEDAYKYRNAKQKAQTKLQKPAIPTFKKKTARGGDTTKARASKGARAHLRKTGSTDALASILVDKM